MLWEPGARDRVIQSRRIEGHVCIVPASVGALGHSAHPPPREWGVAALQAGGGAGPGEPSPSLCGVPRGGAVSQGTGMQDLYAQVQGGTFRWSELEAGGVDTGEEPTGAAGGRALDAPSSPRSTGSAGGGVPPSRPSPAPPPSSISPSIRQSAFFFPFLIVCFCCQFCIFFFIFLGLFSV